MQRGQSCESLNKATIVNLFSTTPRFSKDSVISPGKTKVRFIDQMNPVQVGQKPEKSFSFLDDKSFTFMNPVKKSDSRDLNYFEVAPNLELHITKLGFPKNSNAEDKQGLPPVLSLEKKRSSSCTSMKYPESRGRMKENFHDIFNINMHEGEDSSKRRGYSSGNLFRVTKSKQGSPIRSIKSSATETDTKQTASYRKNTTAKFTNLKMIGIESISANTSRTHRSSGLRKIDYNTLATSREISPVQTPLTNNIYKAKTLIKKPTLSQLKFDLKFQKKLFNMDEITSRYVPVLRTRKVGSSEKNFQLIS